jgi:hypothetical protein
MSAMELQHLIVKIPVVGPLGIDPAKVVDFFHKWVGAQSVPGVLLVDVAELLHVPEGPGVVAVGYEADYALDHGRGTWGLLYRRKTVLPGGNAGRVAQAFEAAAQAAARLEEEFAGALRFSRTEFELIVNDRGIAPNTPETHAAAIPEIGAAVRSLLGHGDFTVARSDRDPRERFGVAVRSSRPFQLATPAAA